MEWRVKFEFSGPRDGTRGKVPWEHFLTLEMLGFGHLRRGSMDKMTNGYFMSLEPVNLNQVVSVALY